MAVRKTATKPVVMAHFPNDYEWLEMHENNDVYGYCAIREVGDTLELHLSMVRWGRQILRRVQEDMEWLKTEARRLGASKIMGIRADSHGKFDPSLFRFSELFGFGEHTVIQTTTLQLE